MEFITVTDVNGAEWVLSKAFIVGLSPTFGGKSWERGAQIHIDVSAFEIPRISISADSLRQVSQYLGLDL